MTWLFAAYAVVWIAVFLYVLGLHQKQQALADEVSALFKKLSERGE